MKSIEPPTVMGYPLVVISAWELFIKMVALPLLVRDAVVLRLLKDKTGVLAVVTVTERIGMA